MLFCSFELFLKIPKVSIKNIDLRPFEVYSHVFRLTLHFWNMSEVCYEKNGVLLPVNVIIFTL
jgi:hypothetical protein